MAFTRLSLQSELKRSRAWEWVPVFAFVLLLVRPAVAQVEMSPRNALQDRIVQEIDVIHAAEQAKLSSRKLGGLWALLASDYESAARLSKSEAAYNHALRLLQAAPDGTADYATVLDSLGSLYIVMGNSDAAENTCKHSLAVRKQVGNQLEITRGEMHLAQIDLAKHKFKEARQESSRAYEMLVALHDATNSDIASALITLTYATSLQGKGADAVASAEKAVIIARAALPADPLLVGEARIALGFAEWKAGAKEAAEPEMRAGLEMLRAGMPPGHPEFLAGLEQYRKFLWAIHRDQDAKQIAAEETQLVKERSRSCDNCTVSAYALSAR